MHVSDDIITSSQDEQPGQPEVMNALNLEVLVKRYIAEIDQTKEQLKMLRQMLNDSFEQDAEYKEQADKAKEVTKQKNAAKQKITQQQSIVEIVEKMKKAKEELRDMEEALGEYARQYYEQSGISQIEGDDGRVREIRSVTKVVRVG